MTMATLLQETPNTGGYAQSTLSPGTRREWRDLARVRWLTYRETCKIGNVSLREKTDLKPYKVPSGEMFNDGVLPYLMADTSFFLALTPYSVKKPIATQEAPFTHGADMIWEACGLHAEEWMNILMILTHSTSRTSEEVVAWLTSGYDTFPYCFRTKPTFDSVTDHFEELAKYGDPGPKMILRQIHQRLETLHSNFNGTNLGTHKESIQLFLKFANVYSKILESRFLELYTSACNWAE